MLVSSDVEYGGEKRWLVGRMWLGEMMKLVAVRALLVWLLFANADKLVGIPPPPLGVANRLSDIAIFHISHKPCTIPSV